VAARAQLAPIAVAARRPAAWPHYSALVALCTLFIACGWPFVRRLGIEVDEALLGNGIYERAEPYYSWHIFGSEIPVMLLTYVGALKTWIYNGLFAIHPPGAVLLRLPMMLVGAGTIWLFFALLDEIHGRRAAWAGAILLATDTTFVLSESVDLGFVALQHAFKLAGIVLLIRFHRRGSRRSLVAGMFLLGLGVWDKALFLWVLIGLAVAATVAHPNEIRRHLKLRPVVLALCALSVGAFPFIQFNIVRPLDTFRTNAKLTPDHVFAKRRLLVESMNGEALLPFLMATAPGPNPGTPHGVLQRMSFAVAQRLGAPVANWMIAALALAVAFAPIWGRSYARSTILFALVFMAVTWLEMALTEGAGAAVHHVILLWPFHLLVIAIAFAEAFRRMGRAGAPVLIAVIAVLAARNLLVTNTNFCALIRNGGSVRWTDAFTPLVDYLKQFEPKRVVVTDWGILETINLVTEGSAPVQDASQALRTLPRKEAAEQLRAMISDPGAVFLRHTTGNEQFRGLNRTLDSFAAENGFEREILQLIHDRNGRAIFEIVRYRRNG
jgi:4-amino-4-deoxy-L-arabinose transferase-like glycosyltransferase